MSKSAAKYSVHLDAVRALAAFVVFAGHARVLFIGTLLGTVGLGAKIGYGSNGAIVHYRVGEVTAPGHEAVIVFFVLSGFLVGGGVIRGWRVGKWTWQEYALQRLTRLWIVLLPALVLAATLDNLGIHNFGMGGIYGGPSGQDMVFNDLPARLSVLTFLGNALFVQDILVKPFGSDSPLWTLSYEFWFYAAFPFLMAGCSKRTAMPLRGLCVVALCGIGWFVGIKIALYFLLWLMGALLELVPKKLTRDIVKWAAPALALGFLVLNVGLLRWKLNIYLSDAIEAVAFCGLCYALLHETEPATESLYMRCARFLSDMSYTLYLTHAPILVFVSAAVVGSWQLWPLDMLHLLYFAGVLLLTFLASCGFYWCFERNTALVRNALRRHLISIEAHG